MTTDTQGTIQEDVPAVEIEAKQEEFIPQSEIQDEVLNEDDPRAAIYQKYDQKRREEMGLEPAQEPAPVEVAKPAADKPDEITVKVNGKERKVSRADVEAAGGIKAYQKAKAADEMLRQAAEERSRAHELEVQMQAKLRALNQYEQELKQRAAQVQAPQNIAPVKELTRKYHEAILDGDMDKADELLLTIQTARPNATADEEAIARRAAAAAKAELIRDQEAAKQQAFERERIEASASFKDDYPDIAEDPDLFGLTNRLTLEIHQREPNLGPRAIFQKAVEKTRSLIGRNAAASDKLEAKRQQQTIRGGTARAAPKPQPRPLSNSQYVEQLRKARGLDV